MVVFLDHDADQLKDGVPTRLIATRLGVLDDLVTAVCNDAVMTNKNMY